ncbi:MAG: hypothetical protein J4F36_13480 [Nitrosopumilaceae archaeon]|nr:hypothetical protein [Nitrosopumilaceae archaeon]
MKVKQIGNDDKNTARSDSIVFMMKPFRLSEPVLSSNKNISGSNGG